MPPILTQQLQLVSNAGLAYTISIVTMGYLYVSGYKKEALLLIVASLGNLFSTVLKFIFKQPRPITAQGNYTFDIYSFPSSHTVLYTALFGFIFYLAFKLTAIPLPLRVIALLVSCYFITLVGVSRVYLGQHYVWDVVAGYVFGVLYLIGAILLDKKL